MMMKTLITFLLCLLSIAGFAATPAFTSFISSNASLVIISNPTTGKILFTVTAGTNGVNGTNGLNGAAGSGALTTNCFTIPNTNLIVVSGAGTSAANGTYRHNPANGAWTNVASLTIGIWFDDVSTFEEQITNAAGVLYSTLNDVPPYSTWTVGVGAGPAPTTAFDNTTNCYSYDFSLTSRTNVIYINCGDTNFLAKISNAPNNSVIMVGPCPQGYTYASWAWASNVNNLDAAWRAKAPPLSLVNKTNVQIIGLGKPRFDSSQSPTADGMVISNCSGITLDGLAFYNVRATNGGTPNGDNMPNVGVSSHQTAAIHLINVEHLLIKNCDIVNWWNFGILDAATSWPTNGIVPCTNDIIIEDNYLANGGSFQPTYGTYDGAAMAMCGGLIQRNRIDEWASGIEPYGTGTKLIFGVRIKDNLLRNVLLSVIQNGGSSNNIYPEITGNTIEWDIGHTRGGSNFLASARAIEWSVGAGATIRGNRIFNCPADGIYVFNGGAPAPGDFIIEDNLIVNSTNAVSGTGSIPIHIGTSGGAPPSRFAIRRNTIKVCVYAGMRLQGVSDFMVEENVIIDANMLSLAGEAGIYAGKFDVAGTNQTLRNNRIVDTKATPRCVYGIGVGAAQVNTRVENNEIVNMLTAPVLNGSFAQTTVVFPEKMVNAVLAGVGSGTYTNLQTDTHVILPAGGNRTNKLSTPFRGHRVTVTDGWQGATGVWVVATSGVINGGPTLTNMSTNYGTSMTLVADGTNWFIRSAYP